ncbi:MAG: hypothetical protein HDS65_00230 [Bacteroidales bacterium]|nr:hypothetical protein [Bacteroidales bacterium]
MKKICLLALAVATFLGANAQLSVVKEAERAMKNGEKTSKVVEIITPAFTNPETSGDVNTWYIPGASAFKEYDHMLGLLQFNKLPENGKTTMGHLLLDGYTYFGKAFPLDSIPDAKGKIKPKKSKEMLNTLAGHYNDYLNFGVELYNERDYQGAYDLWEIYLDAPQNAELAKLLNANKVMPADSLLANIAYNQGLAAWQLENHQAALDAFRKGIKLGYDKKQIYDNALAVAKNLGNNEEVLAIAQAAVPLYGSEDSAYMAEIVNYYLQAKDYDKAFDIINAALAQEPNNAKYYIVQGVLYENVNNNSAAKDSYENAVRLDAENAQANFYYGRMICSEAFNLLDSAPTLQSEYDKYYSEKVAPLLNEAATVLEGAYKLDADNTDILRLLESVYYNLNDEKMLNDVRKRMQY